MSCKRLSEDQVKVYYEAKAKGKLTGIRRVGEKMLLGSNCRTLFTIEDISYIAYDNPFE